MSAHRHLEESDLLRGALEETALDCGECAARAAEYGVVVARLRALLAHESELDARRDSALAERVLARTTRARVGGRRTSSSWSARLKASPVWRLVAAAVLIQLAALPVVAWVAWRRPARPQSFDARLEPPRGPSLPETSEPERFPRIAEPTPRVNAVEGDPAAPSSAATEAARAAERARLGAAALPAFDGATSELDRVARLLVLRAGVVGARVASEELAALAPSDEDGALEQALWCEAALDRWLLGGALEPALAPLLRLLARSEANSERPLALARSLLERAERCGALDAEGSAWLSQARRAKPIDGEALSIVPFDRAWCEALRSALRVPSNARSSNAASESVTASWLKLAN